MSLDQLKRSPRHTFDTHSRQTVETLLLTNHGAFFLVVYTPAPNICNLQIVDEIEVDEESNHADFKITFDERKRSVDDFVKSYGVKKSI